jgi:hypothetical protein
MRSFYLAGGETLTSKHGDVIPRKGDIVYFETIRYVVYEVVFNLDQYYANIYLKTD